jgi:hypothetical protein
MMRVHLKADRRGRPNFISIAASSPPRTAATLGTEHPDTLTSVGNLASALLDQGKYKAGQLNLQALAVVLDRPEHPY